MTGNIPASHLCCATHEIERGTALCTMPHGHPAHHWDRVTQTRWQRGTGRPACGEVA